MGGEVCLAAKPPVAYSQDVLRLLSENVGAQQIRLQIAVGRFREKPSKSGDCISALNG